MNARLPLQNVYILCLLFLVSIVLCQTTPLPIPKQHIITAQNAMPNEFTRVSELDEITFSAYPYILLLAYYPWDSTLDEIEPELDQVVGYFADYSDFAVRRLDMSHVQSKKLVTKYGITSSPQLVFLQNGEIVAPYTSIKKATYIIRYISSMLQLLATKTLPHSISSYDAYNGYCNTQFSLSDLVLNEEELRKKATSTIDTSSNQQAMLLPEFVVLGYFSSNSTDLFEHYQDAVKDLVRLQDVNIYSRVCFVSLLLDRQVELSKLQSGSSERQSFIAAEKKFFESLFGDGFSTEGLIPSTDDDEDDEPDFNDVFIFARHLKTMHRFGEQGKEKSSSTKIKYPVHLLSEWMLKMLQPLLVEMVPRNYEWLMASRKPTLILFTPGDAFATVKDYNPNSYDLPAPLANIFRTAIKLPHHFNYVYMDAIRFDGFYDRLVTNSEIHATVDQIALGTAPTVVILDPKNGEHFICTNCVWNSSEPNTVQSFLTDYIDGKLVRAHKSEHLATEDKISSIPSINYEKLMSLISAKDTKANILLLLYAPMCAHCKNIIPVLEDIHRDNTDNKNLSLYKMDTTKNEIPSLFGEEITGVPSLVLLKCSAENTTKYKIFTGLRTLAKIRRWLYTNMQDKQEDPEYNEESRENSTDNELVFLPDDLVDADLLQKLAEQVLQKQAVDDEYEVRVVADVDGETAAVELVEKKK